MSAEQRDPRLQQGLIEQWIRQQPDGRAKWAGRVLLRDHGEQYPYDTPPKEWTREELDALWEAQVMTNIDRGYAQAVGQTPGRYKDTIPRFQAPPVAYDHRLEIPVIVEPAARVPLEAQLDMAGIRVESSHSGFSVNRIPPNDASPDVPYSMWTHDGTQYSGMSVELARKAAGIDEEQGQVQEGTSLYVHHPELFVANGIFMDGSRIFAAPYVPGLTTDDNGRGVLHLDEDSRTRRPNKYEERTWGALTRGTEVNTEPGRLPEVPSGRDAEYAQGDVGTMSLTADRNGFAQTDAGPRDLSADRTTVTLLGRDGDEVEVRHGAEHLPLFIDGTVHDSLTGQEDSLDDDRDR